MRITRFAEAAKLELIQEAKFYENKEAGLDVRFLASIREVVSRALLYPLTSSPYRKNTRRLFVKDFSFAIIYRCHSDGIVIFAVAHLSKRPWYWRSRIDNS